MKDMISLFIIINIIAFIVVFLWFCFDPSWESGSSCAATFAALLGQFFFNNSEKKNEIGNMNQKAGKNSTQYQSGGNMTINEK